MMNGTSGGGDLRQSARSVTKDPWRKRLRLFVEDRKWVIIGLLCLTGFVLGYLGERKLLAGAGVRHSPIEPFYRAVQLFFFDDSPIDNNAGKLPWELEVARLLAPMTTALMAGTAVIALFREQSQWLRLKFMKDHIVVCGLGQTGLQLVREFHLSRENVVAIEIEQTRGGVSSCRDEGVPVLIGDATEAFILHKARIDRARYLIAVCGEDGINVETALQAQRHRDSARTSLARGPEPEGLQCFVHLTRLELATFVRQNRCNASAQTQLKFFNIAENSARALLREYPPANTDAQSGPHVVIVGFGDMGERLLLQLAKIGHYANGEKLGLIVIAKEAEKREKVLRLRYPQLDQVCDVRFRSLDTEDPEFANALPDRVTTLYVCEESDSRALLSLLTLIPKLEKCRAEIVVCMRQREGLAGLLSPDDERGRPHAINVFPVIESASTREIVLNESLDILAKAIHTTYLEKHHLDTDKPGQASYAVDWDLLPEEIKDSNRQQADHILVKLRAIGCYAAPTNGLEASSLEFTRQEVDLLARMEHSRWRAERLLSGWTHSPAVEDSHERVSPRLIPWDDLPAGAKEYNRQVVREIPALLTQVGLIIIRTDVRPGLASPEGVQPQSLNKP